MNDLKKSSSLGSYLIIAAIVALIALNIWYVADRDDDVGERAPEFSLPVFNPADGAPTEIALSDLRGKVVVMDFWAIHCGPCLLGFPKLEAFYRSMDPERVAVITINEGPSNRVGRRVEGFLSKGGFTVPVLMDNGSVFRAYEIRSIPHLVIVDKVGNVRRIHHGAMDPKVLKREVDDLLDEG